MPGRGGGNCRPRQPIATGFASIAGVENVTGGSGDDTLTGDGSANVIDGGLGADTIDGGEGDDTIVYAAARRLDRGQRRHGHARVVKSATIDLSARRPGRDRHGGRDRVRERRRERVFGGG